MKFIIQQSSGECLPAGNYRAKFKGIEKKDRQDGTEMLLWKFETTKDKKELFGFTDADKPPTVKNKFGRWLAGLTGQPVAANVEVDPNHYLDCEYLCIVTPKQDGQGTKLESFSVIPE